MDECFTLHVHHCGHFTWDPQAYVGGTVDIVDNYDPNKWSKVKIKSICRDFGYTAVDKLWFKMPGVNLEQAHFHEVVNDDAAVFMTDLVKGYEDIHVFVEHPVNEPVELPMEDLKPLTVRPPGSEPKGVNEDVVYCVTNDSELQTDHFYEYAEYEEDNDMRMMMESIELIFHNLEAMIMLKQIMLMKSTDLIFHNLKAMIMLKLLI